MMYCKIQSKHIQHSLCDVMRTRIEVSYLSIVQFGHGRLQFGHTENWRRHFLIATAMTQWRRIRKGDSRPLIRDILRRQECQRRSQSSRSSSLPKPIERLILVIIVIVAVLIVGYTYIKARYNACMFTFFYTLSISSLHMQKCIFNSCRRTK